MTKIEKYGIYCRSWEGGWSNHPNDSGGATMKGVTYTTFCNYRKAKGRRPKARLTICRAHRDTRPGGHRHGLPRAPAHGRAEMPFAGSRNSLHRHRAL